MASITTKQAAKLTVLMDIIKEILEEAQGRKTQHAASEGVQGQATTDTRAMKSFGKTVTPSYINKLNRDFYNRP